MEAWQFELENGRRDAAWDRFLQGYRLLILATIRRFLADGDDVMDAFAHVCEALRANDLRRLRSYSDETHHRARFSTWLVVVTRNLVVDWIRLRDGRPRASVAAAKLTPLQHRIYELVFLRGHSHAEAYERIRSRDDPELRFGPYLRELRTVYRTISSAARVVPDATAGRSGRSDILSTLDRATLRRTDAPVSDEAALAEMRSLLQDVLAGVPDTERAAVQMYVVDDMSADEVARILGLPSAKAVYNRVYRTLAALRARLEGAGYRRESF